MKIVQVVSSLSDESSGPSYSVPRLCESLAVAGANVELHFLGSPPQRLLGACGFGLVSYPRHDVLNVGWSPEMLRGLKEACRSADVVHSNGLWMMPNVYPLWATHKTSAKLVVAPRGTLAPWALKRGWFKKKLFGACLQNSVLRRADMFHATSVKEFEEIRAAGYVQPVAIVPIGMDVYSRRFKVSGCSNGEALGGASAGRRVVYFGRLHKVKRVGMLLRAWEMVTTGNQHSSVGPLGCGVGRHSAFSDWELVIAGPDGGARDELESYVADRRLPRVSFAGEIVGADKYEFLSRADLCVLPSFTENFGVTLAESLACGTPALGSKGTPWSELNEYQCGSWGFDTPDELAAELCKFMSLSDGERVEMGRRGQELIKSRYAWEAVGRMMDASYKWLVNGGRKPSWVKA